jgi:hypothetical protein
MYESRYAVLYQHPIGYLFSIHGGPKSVRPVRSSTYLAARPPLHRAVHFTPASWSESETTQLVKWPSRTLSAAQKLLGLFGWSAGARLMRAALLF